MALDQEAVWDAQRLASTLIRPQCGVDSSATIRRRRLTSAICNPVLEAVQNDQRCGGDNLHSGSAVSCDSHEEELSVTRPVKIATHHKIPIRPYAQSHALELQCCPRRSEQFLPLGRGRVFGDVYAAYRMVNGEDKELVKLILQQYDVRLARTALLPA